MTQWHGGVDAKGQWYGLARWKREAELGRQFRQSVQDCRQKLRNGKALSLVERNLIRLTRKELRQLYPVPEENRGIESIILPKCVICRSKGPKVE